MEHDLVAYDEAHWTQMLSLLPKRARTAFAAACAGRLAATLVDAGTRAGVVSSALEMLHALVTGEAMDDAAELEARFLAAIPDEDEETGSEALLAGDTLVAAVFALRCSGTGQTEDAIWAARRAYDAADWLARPTVGGSVFTPEMEAAILKHPAVQTELRRQLRDLGELCELSDDDGHLERFIERSALEPIPR